MVLLWGMLRFSAGFQVVGVLVAESSQIHYFPAIRRGIYAVFPLLVLLIIRTYALYQSNRYILAYLVCLELVSHPLSYVFVCAALIQAYSRG